MMSEGQAQKFHTDDVSHLGSASDWLKQISHAERLIICGWSNQWVDNAIHRINRYPLDNAIGFPNTYPADSYLFSG